MLRPGAAVRVNELLKVHLFGTGIEMEINYKTSTILILHVHTVLQSSMFL